MRLFEDEVILDLLPPMIRFLVRRPALRQVFLAFFEAGAPGIRGALLCRTRRIDDSVRDAASRGLAAVIILGAGLDTRACRLAELAHTDVLEIDLPQVQEFKKTRLARRFGALPPRVRFVPVDLDVGRLDAALETGGLNASAPALFVWEGVSQYLQPETVDSILDTIARRPVGTVLVFTYVLKEAITGAFRADRSEAFRRSARRRPEQWHFGIDPSELKSFLAARGLTLQHDFGAGEHRADYLRPLGRGMEVSEIERVAIAAVCDKSP